MKTPEYQPGDTVTVLDPRRGRLPAVVDRYDDKTQEYVVILASGTFARTEGLWLKPRRVQR